MKPQIVPATPELLDRFYGKRPAMTARAVAAVVNGVPICVAGLCSNGTHTALFADVRPIMRRRFVKTGVRLAHEVMRMARETGINVVAVPDEDVLSSARFLEYLGFSPTTAGCYQWQA